MLSASRVTRPLIRCSNYVGLHGNHRKVDGKYEACYAKVMRSDVLEKG